jgi:hypothetical protein
MIRFARWWQDWRKRRLVAKLHDDCVAGDAALRAGQLAPFGLCTACEPRVAKLMKMSVPKAQIAKRKSP